MKKYEIKVCAPKLIEPYFIFILYIYEYIKIFLDIMMLVSDKHDWAILWYTKHWYNICTMLDDVEDVGPTLYKCYTTILCLLGLFKLSL